MDGLGIAVCIAFILLMLTILFQSCAPDVPKLLQADGFTTESDVYKGVRVPIPVPLAPVSVIKADPGLLTRASDLPSAPITGLAEASSRPFDDPALEKVRVADLNHLKADMDGFSANELPILEGRSDPSITLRITEFRGEYQRVKDELSSLTQNPGLESTLSRQSLEIFASNMRVLQRQARLFSVNGIQAVEGFYSGGGGGGEGSETVPITPDQLTELSERLQVEINRLGASGSTSPVLAARINIFTSIRQSVDEYVTAVKDGTMKPENIPIKKSDYKKFLPVLGSPPETPVPRIISTQPMPERYPRSVTTEGFVARGEFEAAIHSLDTGNVGHFDWQKRAIEITQNIKRAGMNTADFGCFMPGEVAVSKDYSWRGHTKMICTRLAANADPAIPEQMGCPPVSWKGWRL